MREIRGPVAKSKRRRRQVMRSDARYEYGVDCMFAFHSCMHIYVYKE